MGGASGEETSEVRRRSQFLIGKARSGTPCRGRRLPSACHRDALEWPPHEHAREDLAGAQRLDRAQPRARLRGARRGAGDAGAGLRSDRRRGAGRRGRACAQPGPAAARGRDRDRARGARLSATKRRAWPRGRDPHVRPRDRRRAAHRPARAGRAEQRAIGRRVPRDHRAGPRPAARVDGDGPGQRTRHRGRAPRQRGHVLPAAKRRLSWPGWSAAWPS